MGRDIGYLHHVGHVVEDITAALELYRRMGFVLPPPSCPAMAPAEGEEPAPFGAANTHAEFPRNFIEVVTAVREESRLPDDAQLVPLQAPPDVLPVLMSRIEATSNSLAGYLDRFEGLHILMLESPAIDTAADRLQQADVRHGGVNVVRRPVDTDDGVKLEEVSYLEIDGAPEGRVGAAGTRTHHLPLPEHPNGAYDLVEVILGVPDETFASSCERYERYLGVEPVGGANQADFELDDARLRIVAESALPELLPGVVPVALPAFVAYAVAVRDLAATRLWLDSADIPWTQTASTLSVTALGTTILFR